MSVDHAVAGAWPDRISERRYTLDDAAVALYVNAVGDRSGLYEAGDGVTPPMAVAALGLRGVVEDLHIPGGTLHTSQEMEFLVAVPVGVRVAVRGRRAAKFGARRQALPGRRHQDGRRRRPARAERQEHPGASDVSAGGVLREGDALPAVVSARSTRPGSRYTPRPRATSTRYTSTASTRRSSQFGSTIAHGMMVAAIVSETMATAFGRALGRGRAHEAQVQGRRSTPATR